MAKANYFLLCENLIVDKDNKATIVNVFDALNTSSLPTMTTQFTLAFNLRLEKGDINNGVVNIRVEAQDDTGKLVLKAQTAHKATTTAHNLAASIVLGGKLGFKKQGDYIAKLYVNDNMVADYPFSVKLTKGKGHKK